MTLTPETTRPALSAQPLSPDAAAYPGPMVAIRLLRSVKWLSPAQTLVMHALIARVDNSTGETPAWCAPAMATLADDVHLGLSTVQRALGELERRGLVRITRRWAVGRSGERHRLPSLYRIVLPGYEDASAAPLPAVRTTKPVSVEHPPECTRAPIPDRPKHPPPHPALLNRDENALTVNDMADHMHSIIYRDRGNYGKRLEPLLDLVFGDGFLFSAAYQACKLGLTPGEVKSAISMYEAGHIIFNDNPDVPALRHDFRRYLAAERRIEKKRVDTMMRLEKFDLACKRALGHRIRWIPDEELREMLKSA